VQLVRLGRNKLPTMAHYPLDLTAAHAWATRRGLDIQTNAALPNQLIVTGAFNSKIPIRLVDLRDRGVFWMQVELSQVVPPERVDATCRAIVLVNASVFLGSWNLISQSNKLYFKVTVPVGHAHYADEDLDFLAQTVVTTVIRTGRALLAVALEGADPATALPRPTK
jgi:hypothetical protein